LLAGGIYRGKMATVAHLLAAPVTEHEAALAAESMARAGLDLEAQAMADLGL
jgi:hypothetical protein